MRLRFSLLPRSHGECGWAKYTGSPVAVMLTYRAISAPPAIEAGDQPPHHCRHTTARSRGERSTANSLGRSRAAHAASSADELIGGDLPGVAVLVLQLQQARCAVPGQVQHVHRLLPQRRVDLRGGGEVHHPDPRVALPGTTPPRSRSAAPARSPAPGHHRPAVARSRSGSAADPERPAPAASRAAGTPSPTDAAPAVVRYPARAAPPMAGRAAPRRRPFRAAPAPNSSRRPRSPWPARRRPGRAGTTPPAAAPLPAGSAGTRG